MVSGKYSKYLHAEAAPRQACHRATLAVAVGHQLCVEHQGHASYLAQRCLQSDYHRLVHTHLCNVGLHQVLWTRVSIRQQRA
jgi:hypothetical protein